MYANFVFTNNTPPSMYLLSRTVKGKQFVCSVLYCKIMELAATVLWLLFSACDIYLNTPDNRPRFIRCYDMSLQVANKFFSSINFITILRLIAIALSTNRAFDTVKIVGKQFHSPNIYFTFGVPHLISELKCIISTDPAIWLVLNNKNTQFSKLFRSKWDSISWKWNENVNYFSQNPLALTVNCTLIWNSSYTSLLLCWRNNNFI